MKCIAEKKNAVAVDLSQSEFENEKQVVEL